MGCLFWGFPPPPLQRKLRCAQHPRARRVAEGGGRAARFGGWAIVVPLSRVSGEMLGARFLPCAQLPRFES